MIGVNTTGSNNLDFHLAFYIGRFHEIAEKEIEFHIVSNDSGFNGLVNHLKKIGRSCKKIATKETNLKPKKVGLPSLSNEASSVVARLKQLDGRKRPRKKAGLLNWIKSQGQAMTNGALPEVILKELITAKLIRDSGNGIGYEI